MNIILNEKAYAEKCLKEHTLGENSYESIKILAKYFYWILDYRKKQIEKELSEFIKENDSQYRNNVARWEEVIEEVAKQAGKLPLYEENYVPITKSEWERIMNCGLSKQHQQVLFSYLCFAKLGNMRYEKNDGWVNHKTKDVFNSAHVNASERKQDIMLNELYVAGLVEFPKKNDNLSVRVTFCDANDSHAYVSVSDFQDLGYFYLQQLGENIVHCAECGRLIRGNKAGTRKYCNDCAGYIPQEFQVITCVDCGKEFRINSKNRKTIRCDSCRETYDREMARLRKRRSRENRNVTSANKS